MSKILVTRPFLPPLEEVIPYLEEIWESKWLTNNGQLHQRLEKELADFLDVPYVSLFANGTLALITSLQALEIKGEVITTPYSFVATSHSVIWTNCRPVFVDIEPEHCNLDPDQIEQAITPATKAIMPVHVYGYPCNVRRIQEIARKHGLKVIYDAAHAFGVRLNGEGILNYGDLSVLSFHATKIYNTFEGGAIACHDPATKQKIDDLKNFGFRNEVTVVDTGFNAKMNEFQAAIGLVQLKHYTEGLDKRRLLYEEYEKGLNGINGLRWLKIPEGVDYNYSYFPVFIDRTKFRTNRDGLADMLKKEDIFCRKYFYPLITDFQAYSRSGYSDKTGLKAAEQLADEVLCLPMYTDLRVEDVRKITEIIRGHHHVT